MSEKVTPWFSGEVKPVRVGVYQRDYSSLKEPDCYFYNKWNGSRWLFIADTPLDAENERAGSLNQYMPWRGLARKP